MFIYIIGVLNVQRCKKFCTEHNIELTNDYSNQNINRDTRITGKCKNLVITHREMCMKFQQLRQNISGLFPVLNIDFTIFNIFCTAFLSLL